MRHHIKQLAIWTFVLLAMIALSSAIFSLASQPYANINPSDASQGFGPLTNLNMALAIVNILGGAAILLFGMLPNLTELVKGVWRSVRKEEDMFP